jgi:hypothetical protein
MGFGCQSLGVFTQSGATTANAIVTEATNFLNIVTSVIPVLTTLTGLPEFVTKATAYLNVAKSLEASLKTFIAAHTAQAGAKTAAVVTTTDQAKLDALKTQVTQLISEIGSLQTSATKSLVAQNSKMRAMLKDK